MRLNVRYVGTLPCVCYGTTNQGQGHFAQRKKKKGWTGWKPSTEDGKIEFRKMVMGANEAENRDSFPVIQKDIEEAAKSIGH